MRANSKHCERLSRDEAEAGAAVSCSVPNALLTPRVAKSYDRRVKNLSGIDCGNRAVPTASAYQDLPPVLLPEAWAMVFPGDLAPYRVASPGTNREIRS